MDDIDPDAFDAKIETGRQQLVSTFRRIADRLEAMSPEDVSRTSEIRVHYCPRCTEVGWIR